MDPASKEVISRLIAERDNAFAQRDEARTLNSKYDKARRDAEYLFAKLQSNMEEVRERTRLMLNEQTAALATARAQAAATQERAVLLEILDTFPVHSVAPPVSPADEPWVIRVKLPGHGQSGCYGKTLTEAAERALRWLTERGWKPTTALTSPQGGDEHYEKAAYEIIHSAGVKGAFTDAGKQRWIVRILRDHFHTPPPIAPTEGEE